MLSRYSLFLLIFLASVLVNVLLLYDEMYNDDQKQSVFSGHGHTDLKILMTVMLVLGSVALFPFFELFYHEKNNSIKGCGKNHVSKKSNKYQVKKRKYARKKKTNFLSQKNLLDPNLKSEVKKSFGSGFFSDLKELQMVVCTLLGRSGNSDSVSTDQETENQHSQDSESEEAASNKRLLSGKKSQKTEAAAEKLSESTDKKSSESEKHVKFSHDVRASSIPTGNKSGSTSGTSATSPFAIYGEPDADASTSSKRHSQQRASSSSLPEREKSAVEAKKRAGNKEATALEEKRKKLKLAIPERSDLGGTRNDENPPPSPAPSTPCMSPLDDRQPDLPPSPDDDSLSVNENHAISTTEAQPMQGNPFPAPDSPRPDDDLPHPTQDTQPHDGPSLPDPNHIQRRYWSRAFTGQIPISVRCAVGGEPLTPTTPREGCVNCLSPVCLTHAHLHRGCVACRHCRRPPIGQATFAEECNTCSGSICAGCSHQRHTCLQYCDVLDQAFVYPLGDLPRCSECEYLLCLCQRCHRCQPSQVNPCFFG